jgi:hypothetical protein
MRSPTQAARFRKFQPIVGSCFICKLPALSSHLQAGHIQSVDHKGESESSNFKMICTSCNLAMGTTNLYAYHKFYYDVDPPIDIQQSTDFIQGLNELEWISLDEKKYRKKPPKYVSQQVWYKIFGVNKTGHCLSCKKQLYFPSINALPIDTFDDGRLIGLTCNKCIPLRLPKHPLKTPVIWSQIFLHNAENLPVTSRRSVFSYLKNLFCCFRKE